VGTGAAACPQFWGPTIGGSGKFLCAIAQHTGQEMADMLFAFFDEFATAEASPMTVRQT